MSLIMCRPIDIEFSHIQNGIWVVLVTMSTIGYGDLYPNTDIGRFLIVVCCGFAILALVLMIIGFRSFFAPTARELQVFHRLRFSKWLERAKLSAAVVIQSFWRSCLNVKRSQETAGYSMRQFPTYLQDTNLSHKIRAFHNVRLERPLEFYDAQTLIKATQNCLWDADERLGSIKELLIPNARTIVIRKRL